MGNGESLLNGYRISVEGDVKVLENGSDADCTL
jgi:hypothetical protein